MVCTMKYKQNDSREGMPGPPGTDIRKISNIRIHLRIFILRIALERGPLKYSGVFFVCFFIE